MTKTPDYQWGPREDRTAKKYKAIFALEDLLDHGEISYAHKDAGLPVLPPDH